MNTPAALLIKERKEKSVYSQKPELQFDIQSYRGGQGLMPANTIAACIESIRNGATTLHLDVAMNIENELLAVQDVLLKGSVYSYQDGKPLSSADAAQFNIYNMTYEQIMQFDCGNRRQPNLPEQKLISASIPLLRHLVDRVEKFVIWNRRQPVKYNFEIKSFEGWDDILQPKPEVFALAMYDLIRKKAVLGRSLITSADVRVLKVFRKINSEVKIAYQPEELSWKAETEILQWLKPDFIIPDFRLVNRNVIESLHARDIKVLPKVVNEILDINEMKQLGADGVITDYPDRAMKVLN